jgi:hypothetical protein
MDEKQRGRDATPNISAVLVWDRKKGNSFLVVETPVEIAAA